MGSAESCTMPCRSHFRQADTSSVHVQYCMHQCLTFLQLSLCFIRGRMVEAVAYGVPDLHQRMPIAVTD